ncbi:hypothetical protein AVEN_188982-1 [Araneus ventricosus]|uniref:Uncharacterized protein n=1 Tax=Araneus ventricosus TaxID=182803 RepID=A0A4Y2LV63_ARAVE|nr:hypothetical protein AVEN_188982-1 [Araneus ventricosus]
MFVSSDMPSSSQNLSFVFISRVVQSTISSTFKDLKCAKLQVISPKASNFTTAYMNNSKQKCKCMQTRTGEILTSEDEIERLKTERENSNVISMQKKYLEMILQKIQLWRQSLTVGAWVKALYLREKSKPEFIGKIMAVEGDTCKMKYLQNLRWATFIFLAVDDTDYIKDDQIIKILNEPQFNNRGQFFEE